METKSKGLNTRQWKLYHWLKENCVSLENAKNGSGIVAAMKAMFPDEFTGGYCERALKKDISALRTCPLITRAIGSDSQHGYWMACTMDQRKAMAYSIDHCLNEMKNLIKMGVPKELFFKVLNGEKNIDIKDLQMTLKLTPYEQDTVHVYSDDLEKKGN